MNLFSVLALFLCGHRKLIPDIAVVLQKGLFRLRYGWRDILPLILSSYQYWYPEDFLRAQMVKNLPSMQETWVQSLGQEDLLEKEMATHSAVFLSRESHGQRSLEGYSPWGHKELDTAER